MLAAASVAGLSGPVGASTGANEVTELRYGDGFRYHGNGVCKVAAALNGPILGAMAGWTSED